MTSKATPKAITKAVPKPVMSVNPEEAKSRALKNYPRHDAALVANITTQLVSSKLFGQIAHATARESYLYAAREAIALLDAVGKAVIEREERIAELAQVLQRPNKMSFNEGVKYITGEPRFDRALQKYTDFVAAVLRAERTHQGRDLATPDQARQYLSEALAHDEKYGFGPHQLLKRPAHFQHWYATQDGRKSKPKGNQAMPQKKVKKILEPKKGRRNDISRTCRAKIICRRDKLLSVRANYGASGAKVDLSTHKRTISRLLSSKDAHRSRTRVHPPRPSRQPVQHLPFLPLRVDR